MLKKLLCKLGMHYHHWNSLDTTQPFVLKLGNTWYYTCPWCNINITVIEYKPKTW